MSSHAMKANQAFVATVTSIFGRKGQAWLKNLPAILAKCRRKFQLNPGRPSPHLSINYVEFTETTQGRPVVLKVGVPHLELFSEMEALKLYDGCGVVELIDYDKKLGAMLLAKVNPGTMLWELRNNQQEARIAAGVIQTLAKPVPKQCGLPTFYQWIAQAFRQTRTNWDPQEHIPRILLDTAEAALKEIQNHSRGHMMLHGDLHHENILYDERQGWTVIDPKGVIGPAILEVGRFLHNRLPANLSYSVRLNMIRERLNQFESVLGVDQNLLSLCCLVDWVLSLCWTLEEGDASVDWANDISLLVHFAKVFV